MRLTIVAIGRLKDSGERMLCDRYIGRLASARGRSLGPLVERELPESRLGSAPERRAEEATRLLKAAQGADAVILLDERGTSMSSEAFARWLGLKQDNGARHAAFLIGGPDGHGDSAKAAAELSLSLGLMTLPHGLARVILAEQLYRASTILAGHPYHRA